MLGREDSVLEEPVHILAYYSGCGPTNSSKLDVFLKHIREGRYLRAKNMVSKLSKLNLPIKWENVAKIAGKGVAPGRLHIARAMLEAGHVENLKQAFSRYLYDDGPAYSRGSEPTAEDTINLILETGGVAVLAHPWALKNPSCIIRKLKEVGLHGVEVYRSDGKLSVYSDLADGQSLLKLGGSDYHGRGGANESELGSTSLPLSVVHEFLKVAQPIWREAILNILQNYINDPSDVELQRIIKQTNTRSSLISSSCSSELINHCLSSWLSKEERETSELEALKSEFSKVLIAQHHLELEACTKTI